MMRNPFGPNGYPFMVGWLLGLLQTALFFQLTFALSSGFTTYLLITLCWLLGGAVGVYYVQRTSISLRALLIVTLAAYGLCGLLVNSRPFDSDLLPVYAALLTTAGLYPGVFFARASRRWSTRSLFFWENNGFIVGLVSCTLLFMLVGRSVLGLPIVVGIGLWWIYRFYETRLTANTA